MYVNIFLFFFFLEDISLLGYSEIRIYIKFMLCSFERVVDLNPEKLGPYRPGQYKPSEEDFKPGFKEKMRFFKYFFISDNVCKTA